MSRRDHHTRREIRTPGPREPDSQEMVPSLEIVLKCDSAGSLEAVVPLIQGAENPQVPIEIIHSGVGPVTKSDLQMALTGSRLVIGFNVDVMPEVDPVSREKGVEVRLYNVIYRLADDLKEISGLLLPPKGEEERITGEAQVIALFKGRRGGIILGCEVVKGALALGDHFRIISAMGQKYNGRIESLHIEKDAVKEARKGQKVGLQILDFKDAKIGDIVECVEVVKPESARKWRPRGGVFRYEL